MSALRFLELVDGSGVPSPVFRDLVKARSAERGDILKKISDGGYTHNGLYELVPVGGQDFSQVLPKIKANEPDILLVSNYGQDPGSFANQASTAGLKAIRIGFEFTPDGLNASKGTYDSDGYTFAYGYACAHSSTMGRWLSDAHAVGSQ